MILDSFDFTYIGGRSENQDSLGKKESPNSGIYVVADGLGGHEKGQLASDCVVNHLVSAWNAEAEKNESWLKEQIGLANEKILRLQQENDCVTKTTVVALSIEKNRAVWANTGDSRLYYLHDGGILHITEDHSVAYKKYKSGEITRAQIAFDEDQSSLLRALGNTSRWEPDTYSVDGICAGDAFLLCTDGLWEYVLDEEILVEHLKSETAQAWGRKLLLRAIDRVVPGTDNVSLIAVMVE